MAYSCVGFSWRGANYTAHPDKAILRRSRKPRATFPSVAGRTAGFAGAILPWLVEEAAFTGFDCMIAGMGRLLFWVFA